MEIKQLTYTSLEKGWDVDRVLGEVTSKERDTFSSICSHRSTKDVMFSFDLSNNIYVLACSVPCGVDLVNRPKSYTHGYLFSGNDANELFENYGLLLGIEYFAGSVQDKLVHAESIISEFSDKAECDNLPKLIECVYEAVVDGKCFEIRTDTPNRILFIRKIMNTFYEYLPLSLRKLITFSSATGEIMRTVTATDKFSSMAELKYDFSSGQAKGLTGKYSGFVQKLFTDKKDELIASLENKIRFYEQKELKSLFTDIIENILMNNVSENSVTQDSTVDKLIEFVHRNRYGISGDAKIINDLISDIISRKINCSEALYKKLAEVYDKTDFDELKGNIVNLLALKYGADCTPSVYSNFLAYYKLSADLFMQVTEKAIQAEYVSFIDMCAVNALDNPEYAELIKYKCAKVCADYISAFIARKLTEKAEKELFDKSFDSVLHEDILRWLLKLKADEDVVWQYFLSVYSSAKRFKLYLKLDSEILNMSNQVFCKAIKSREEECLILFDTACRELGANDYMHIVEILKKCGERNIIERLYVEILSKSAKSETELERYKCELEKTGIDTDGFVRSTLDRYAEFCIKSADENNEQVSDTLKRIKEFAGGAVEINGENLDKIKAAFWEKLSFKKIKNITDDVRLMSLADNDVSVLANALLNLSEYVSGDKKSISVSDFKVCRDNLCKKSNVLSANEQKRLLKHLKKLSDNARAEIDIDIFMLINYSHNTKRVNFKNVVFTAKELKKYLERKESMLVLDGAYKSLYRYIKAKERGKKKIDIRQSFAYTYLLQLMRKNRDDAIKASHHFYGSGCKKPFAMFLYGLLSLFAALLLNMASGGIFMTGAAAVIAFSVSAILYLKNGTDKKILHENAKKWLYALLIVVYGCYFIIF